MADAVAETNPVTNPLGTAYDAPATADQLTQGAPTDGSPAPTIFSLLKGILLVLTAMADDRNGGI